MDELHYQLDLLKAKNMKLEKNDKMYNSLIQTSSNAFLYYSFENDKFETLAAWDNFFDFKVNSINDLNRIVEIVNEQQRLQLIELLFLEKKSYEHSSYEICIQSKKQWLECEVTVVYKKDGTPDEKIIRFKDITKFKNQNDELAYLAYYDSLTGLYNRNYFVRVLTDWMHKAQTERSVIAVLFIDIDDFRKINDGMGLIVGDELVQVFGQILSTFSNDNVIVSHFNSDMYCMAIYDPCGMRSVESIYHSIRERLEKPLLLTNNNELNISVCVGVAEYPEASQTALELINFAEIVMFKAKALGKNSIQYFDAPILNDFLRAFSIENKLKEALLDKQFLLNFQPMYDLKTQKLRGIETLLRWRDREGEMISPGEFIPIAERNGTIVPIGNWVIEEALKTYAMLRRKYQLAFTISINISAIQYKKPEFVGDLIATADKYGVDPHFVELEITEGILIDDFKEVVEKMYALRDYGFKVSLDDFGTGFSSLAYLKGLPIDTLKIDKSFIDTVSTDNATRIITEATIEMAKRLGYETVAEGVETNEQLTYLKEINCDYIQGFLLSKPMDTEHLEQLIIKLL